MAEVAAQHFAGNAIKIDNANQVLSVTFMSNVTSFHGLLYPAAGVYFLIAVPRYMQYTPSASYI